MIFPPDVVDIAPVSSETISVVTLAISDIPIAALCLKPYSFDISSFVVTGSITLALSILFLLMTNAPSCSGAFLKNILLSNGADKLASIRIPDEFK